MTHESTRAIIHEIFSGIQGEGMLVGVRQIFIRFHGCQLQCAYCDTPASRETPPASCSSERAAGSRLLDSLANPLTVETLLEAVMRLHQGYPHHSVSLTGGEPLLHAAFLDRFLPHLHVAGIPSMLETNGTLAEALLGLATPPHYVAMDIKLPSVTACPPQWEAHAAFLAAAVRSLPGEVAHALQVKVVFGAGSLEEVARAADCVAACRADIPFILQPVTPRAAGPQPPSAAEVLEAQHLAARQLANVRVIPQTHVMLGQW